MDIEEFKCDLDQGSECQVDEIMVRYRETDLVHYCWHENGETVLDETANFDIFL